MNVADLRKMSMPELQKELINLRQEQFNLRMQASVRPHQYGQVRTSIAQVKTIITEKQREGDQ